jgi:kynurenine formamidase
MRIGESEWMDLSQAFEEGIPVPDWPGEQMQPFELVSYHVKVNTGLQNIMRMNLHCGTHVDAPSHYAPGRAHIDQVGFEDLMGECVILDVEKEPLGIVTAQDLRRYQGLLRSAPIAFLSTGWERTWRTGEYGSKYPFLSEDAGELLLEVGTKVVGLDTPGPDAPIRSPFRKGDPLHQMLLGRDVLIIENLTNLRPLVGHRVFVYALPIKIRGATGAPARIVARLLEG